MVIIILRSCFGDFNTIKQNCPYSKHELPWISSQIFLYNKFRFQLTGKQKRRKNGQEKETDHSAYDGQYKAGYARMLWQYGDEYSLSGCNGKRGNPL